MEPFNRDISKWDVSSVVSLNYMFLDTASSNRKFCGAAWVNAKASKRDTFEGSSIAPLESAVLCTAAAIMLSFRCCSAVAAVLLLALLLLLLLRC